MISKSKIKLISSLETRKYRQKYQMFVAEGDKLIGELMLVQKPLYVAALPEWQEKNSHLISSDVPMDVISWNELRKVSFQKTPQSVLALFPIPDYTLSTSLPETSLCIALDGVQDPGNLGTIVRLADWFGINDIICSQETADVYNPKAVQATMGALARIRVHYVNLPNYLREVKAPVFGTFLDGEDIYQTELAENGVIVMGNEGKGISDAIRSMVSHKLYIPNYPLGRVTTESLNVAIATSITCAEFRRRLRFAGGK